MNEEFKTPESPMDANPVVDKTEVKEAPMPQGELKAAPEQSDANVWKTISIIMGIMLLGGVLFLGYNHFSTPTANAVLGSGSDSITGNAVTPTTALKDGAVKVDFYVMSQCPYGTQVEDAIAPVLKTLGDAVDFNLNFIATDLGDGEFKSLHGEPEVKGNIVHLCAAKYNPDKYMDMIVCQNKDARSIPDNWEGCAEGLNKEKIKSCYEGDEGRELLSENVKLAEKVGASGSPTIYVNDEPYSGGRSETDFLRSICNEYGTDRPQACSDIPAPAEVNAIVLSDKRCAECDTSNLVGQLKGLFPGLKVENRDYMDANGKALFDATGTKLLPAIFFDENVKDGEGYKQVETYLEEVDEYYALKIGGAFDPSAEVCDNDKDDDEDGKVDCDDSDCKSKFECMEKLEKPTVELFIMSHCPYGTQTEKGMLPVADLLGDKIDFKVKFVNYAMHGAPEIYEQLNQYCIQKEQENKFIPYLKCFLEDSKGDACLTSTKIDVDAMKKCTDAADTEFDITKNFEDKSLWLNDRFPVFNTDADDVVKYGIKGSPGLAVNGVNIDSFARDPASLLKIVCTGFKNEPSECSESLSSDNPAPGFGFGAAPTAAAASTGGGCGV